MRYVPWDELGGRPNVVVDGYPADGTVLTLSHWKGSGSPEELADDLSTQIVFRYLDRSDLRVDADAVSNDHFDEDGLCGIWSVLNPDEALARRARIIEVARAGDFSTTTDREAARITFALWAFADEDRSPLKVFDRPYPQMAAALYEELLPRVPELLDHPDRFRDLWETEDAWFARDDERVARGEVTIDERPALDLAIVRAPDDGPGAMLDDDAGWSAGVHPMAVYNRTARHRVLFERGHRYSLRYRYETWVRYVSMPTMPRIDLAPLAARLNAEETDAEWTFGGIDQIVPSLRTKGGADSAIAPERFEEFVEGFLSGA